MHATATKTFHGIAKILFILGKLTLMSVRISKATGISEIRPALTYKVCL